MGAPPLNVFPRYQREQINQEKNPFGKSAAGFGKVLIVRQSCKESGVILKCGNRPDKKKQRKKTWTNVD